MEELKKYRESIDLIDMQIRELFLERMITVEKIAYLKMENDMTVYDHTREDEIIHKNLDSMESLEYKDYYREVLETILKVSREYQKAIIFRSTL